MKTTDLAVLLLGQGAREDALAWKISQSPLLKKLFVAPGNPGTMRYAENVPIKVDETDKLIAFCKENGVDLVIIGPEDPLCNGIVDDLRVNGIAAFGPTQAGAQIEASKGFAKEMMRNAGVPTARYRETSDHSVALGIVLTHFSGEGPNAKPLVIKADGLAAGKGAKICRNPEEAIKALDGIMVKKVFGDAGKSVVIEEFIEGPEVSTQAICDGETYVDFPPSQDHKPLFAGSTEMTGGMGTIVPVPWMVNMDIVCNRIFAPTLGALAEAGCYYEGVLYPGLKGSREDPRVLEFNCRFGDPEMEGYARHMKSDLLGVIVACINGKLGEVEMEWNPGYVACVIAASGGYPGKYEKGLPIDGIEEAEKVPGVVVFHAGTAINEDGRLVTNGGRVLAVTAIGDTLEEALASAYEAIKCIGFKDMYYREDIGQEALSLMPADAK